MFSVTWSYVFALKFVLISTGVGIASVAHRGADQTSRHAGPHVPVQAEQDLCTTFSSLATSGKYIHII